MKAARIIFAVATIFGVLALAPGLFSEAQYVAWYPPEFAHPVFYYGFIGAALSFQLIYAMIAVDPARYRPFMLIGVIGKLSFFMPCVLLYQAGRLEMGTTLAGAMGDGVFALLFLWAWFHTRGESS